MKLFLALALLQAVAFVAARDNAALIIGGYWYFDDDPNGPIKDKAELFGCPGVEGSIDVDDYPDPTYLAGGVLYQDNEKVIVCGGYGCDGNDVCSTTEKCRWWNPTTFKDWPEAPALKERRFNFLMANVPHKDYQGMGNLPLSLGYGYDTEIFHKRDGEWQSYYQISDRNWYSQGCLIDYNGKIYSMRDQLIELDPLTWTETKLSDVPSGLVRAGKCVGLDNGDLKGIFTKYGYWVNLETQEWTKLTPPPVDPIAGTTNVLFTFNGKPTIFGNPDCDDVGVCQNNLVVQFDLATNSWSQIGKMNQARIYQTVIEVPGSWCDAYGATEGPTDATTTDGSATINGSLAVLVSAVLFSLFKY